MKVTLSTASKRFNISLCTISLCTLAPALALLSPTAHAQVLPMGVEIQVGYADGLRSGPGRSNTYPDPWEGSPGTIFDGNGTDFDGGAIRIVNNSGSSLTLTSASVDNFDNGASFALWGGYIGAGQVIPNGESLILTQTTDNNFDTSDQPIQGPTSPGSNHGSSITPHINLSLAGVDGGTVQTFVDQTQTLNTLGYDIGGYGYVLPNGQTTFNESFGWRDYNSSVIGPGTVPEPGNLICMSALSVVGATLLRRKRVR